MSTTIKPRRASVTIYHGDDLETLGELSRAAESEARREVAAKAARQAVAESEVDGAGRMGDDWNDGAPEVHDVPTTARQAYNAFVDEAAGRALVVVVEALGRGRFRDLIEAHPVRKTTVTVKPPATDENPDPEPVEREVDELEDVVYGGYNGKIYLGANVTTYPDALLTFDDGERRTIVEPEFKTAAALAKFLNDDLGEDDFERIWVTAHTLNRGSATDPKAKTYTLSFSAT